MWYTGVSAPVQSNKQEGHGFDPQVRLSESFICRSLYVLPVSKWISSVKYGFLPHS